MTSGQAPLEDSVEPFPLDQTFGEYRSDVWKAILEDPPNLAERGDPGIDGDTAYRLYLFFRWCGSVPTTERSADVHFQQWADEIADATDEKQLRGLKWSAGRDFRLYEFCRVIPPEVDRRLESVKWLGEAVRLDHEVAQIEYYESIIQMISA